MTPIQVLCFPPIYFHPSPPTLVAWHSTPSQASISLRSLFHPKSFAFWSLKPAFGLIRKRNFRRTLEVPCELYPPCQIFVCIIRIELFLRRLILPLILPFCRYVLVFCSGFGFLGIHFEVLLEMNGRRGSTLRRRRMRDRSATCR